MPGSFSLQSVAVPLLWDDYFTADQPAFVTITSSELLNRIVGLGANDVRLVGSYGQLASVNGTSYAAFDQQTIASLKTFTDAAHAAGLTITWNPISHMAGVIGGDPNQSSHLDPSDAEAWFQAFRATVLANAQLAQAIGAERFQFISDIEQPVFESHPELASETIALIAEVRTVYNGEITTNIYTADGLVERFPRSILAAVDVLGLGLTPKLTDSSDATVDDLLAGWGSEAYAGRDIIDNLARLSAETGKHITLSDFVASSYDGSNTLSPNKFDGNATFVPDNTEQANYYQAAFREFVAWGGDWFDGLSVQNISRVVDDNGLMAPYVQSDVGENFYGKPAQQVLTSFFTGQAPLDVLVQYGSDYGETVTGGHGYNEIHAGRANQTLVGGDLADTFFSSMPGTTQAHTLQLDVSGLAANGLAPTFEIKLNGTRIPLDYTATVPLSPTDGETITLKVLGSAAIGSIDLATTNWYISGADNRLIRVHSISLDGQDLAPVGTYHTYYGGTEAFVGDTNRGGYVTYDTSSLTLAAPSTVTLAANLSIDGGDGVDTVVYQGNRPDFAIVFDGQGNPTVTKPGAAPGQGVDTLSHVEILAFDDVNLWVSPVMAAYWTSAPQHLNLSAGSQSTTDFGRGTVTVTNAYDIGVAVGGSGDDTVIGSGVDNLIFAGAGSDTLFGAVGNDGLFFGPNLDPTDNADGGDGFDQVGLQGDYSAGLTLGANSLVNIEQIVLLTGSDTRFGDPGTNLYSYNLTTDDANVAAGQRLVVSFNTLRVGENVTFDGSAESDGWFITYAGKGADHVIGGQQSDGFFFGVGRWNTDDSIDGQGGLDQLGLQGNYTAAGSGAIVFGAGQLTGTEVIVCLSGGDSRFGAPSGQGYSYALTMNDGNVGAGQTLYISANTLKAADGSVLLSDETLTFDGSAESDGRFVIYSGNGADTIVGGAGGDTIYGGGGADTMTGGGGNDSFAYIDAAHSTASAMDQILDFAGGDSIDLHAIDAVTGGSDDPFAFVGSTAFSHTAGELRAFEQTPGHWQVEGDVDGDGVADLVIAVTTDHALTGADFVL